MGFLHQTYQQFESLHSQAMKKIWVFVEGDTEDYFISDLIRQMFCNKIVIEKDLTVFVQTLKT